MIIPKVILFTGFSGAGKTTLGNLLVNELESLNISNVLIDGDTFREKYTPNLGFSKEDRGKNLELAGNFAKEYIKNGVFIVLLSFIAPFNKDRLKLREFIQPYVFKEIYLSSTIEVCEKRDVKGLYKKARSGEIQNFTGIDGVYEIPTNPDLIIPTHEWHISRCIDTIISDII